MSIISIVRFINFRGYIKVLLPAALTENTAVNFPFSFFSSYRRYFSSECTYICSKCGVLMKTSNHPVEVINFHKLSGTF